MADDEVPAAPVLEGEVLPPARPTGRFVMGDPRINRTKGKGRGAKDKLGAAFVKDLLRWHSKYGMKAIERVGRDSPAELLRIISSLAPKEVNVGVDHGGTVTFRPVDVQEISRRTRELLTGIADREIEGSGES